MAVGHEGVHAILVLDNGSALFTGIARRGEDGDAMKHRRAPKPTRPKKIFKVSYLLNCKFFMFLGNYHLIELSVLVGNLMLNLILDLNAIRISFKF